MDVWLRLDVELVLAKAWWSLDGIHWNWVKAGSIHRDPQMAFIYDSTRLGWEATHSQEDGWQYPLSFTTMHPGIFAGGLVGAALEVDYWNYTDNEVWPVGFH